MADNIAENPSDRSQRGDVFMVFPYMDHDLCGLLSNNAFIISNSINKLLFRQILEGMDFIHAVSCLTHFERCLFCQADVPEQLHTPGYQDCQYPR